MSTITRPVVSGKASVLNNKISKVSIHEKDDWSRSVQATIPITDSSNQQQAVTSLNWIHAFRNQTGRSQDVMIPSVQSQYDEDDSESFKNRPFDLIPRNTTSKSPEATSPTCCPNKEQISSNNILLDDDFRTETSVKLVQDYIDYSSAINPRTPSLPGHRPVTSVTAHHKSVTNTSPVDTKNSSLSALKPQYVGMDKDDCISLIAPRFQPHQEPNFTITSIQSPREHSHSRKIKVSDNNRSISESNSLLGIGGEILERDSLYVSVVQDSRGPSTEIAISGNSFSPIKAPNKHLLPPTARELSREYLSASRSKSREIHMQLPIPSQTSESIELPTRREDVLTDSVASLQSSARHHEGQHQHNSSILTKFVTSNTQHIINQYLGVSIQKSSRPTTQSSHQYHLPRAVTPSLEVTWQHELQEQQRALRSIFQSKPRLKHPTKPHPPPHQKKSLRQLTTRNIHSAGPGSIQAPVGQHSYQQMLVSATFEEQSLPSTARSRVLRTPDSHCHTDTDSVGDIHAVLNQMSQSQVASETIKPLERYGDRDEMIDEILDQLEAFEPLHDDKEAIIKELKTGRRSSSSKREELEVSRVQLQLPGPIQPNTAPRLLLTSPRVQYPPHPTSVHLPPSAKISLPAVAGSPRSTPHVHPEGSTLNSLSIATLPQSQPNSIKKTAELDGNKKTISHRILRTHQSSTSAVKRR